MKSVFWKDVFNFDYDDRIESKGILPRLFVIFLIPLKYLLMIIFFLAVVFWVFSGAGIMLIMANLSDYGELGFLGWFIIILDYILLIGVIITKLLDE